MMIKKNNYRSSYLTVYLTLVFVAGSAGLCPILSADTARDQVKAFDLRVEGRAAPHNVDRNLPRFSWKIKAGGSGVMQTAYRLVVEEMPSQKMLWDSGQITGDRQLWVPYEGQSLRSSTPYRWRVWIHTADRPGVWSDWATFNTAVLSPDQWQAAWIGADYEYVKGRPGFKPYVRQLAVRNNPAHEWVPQDDAVERWIRSTMRKSIHGVPPEQALAYQLDRLEELQPAPMFRKCFEVKPGLERAVLHYGALGVVEMSVNGQRIRNHTWDPAFTNYRQRVFYLTADITAMLSEGANTLGAMVGDGWYAQSIGFSSLNGSWKYGDPALIAQIELFFADGTVERIVTDETWSSTLEGPVVKNNVWAGELYDARRQMNGWNEPGFLPDQRWTKAVVLSAASIGALHAQHIEEICQVERSGVVEITEPQPGTFVVDFGRILSGYPEIELRNQPAGSVVLMTLAQSLNPNGLVSKDSGITVATWPVDLYVCKGASVEQWHPRFTFHAFRYMQVEGMAKPPRPEDFSGVFTATAMTSAGQFECASSLLNQLHHAIVRTTLANARHFYSDTPSRERTGWMTWPNVLSLFDNFDAYPFFRKWMGDALTSARKAVIGNHLTSWSSSVRSGAVKPVFDSGRQGIMVENVGQGMTPGPRGSNIPEQRTSNILYPWQTYVRYGDIEMLERHYQLMKNTVDFIADTRIDGLVPSVVGDWHDAVKPDLDISYRHERALERDDTWGAIGGGYPTNTPARACATVHLWLAADALAKAAEILDQNNDAVQYSNLADALRDAFNRAYLDPATGRYAYSTPGGKTYQSQTIYGYAIYHGLVPEELRDKTAQRFLEHITECRGHFTSGQLGTDRVVKALTDIGHEQDAFDLLTVKGFPGFDHMLSFGTETTWETWGEAILNNTPAGSKHIIRATRPQEHCQFTGVDSFFYEFVLGIRPDPAYPAYKRFTLKPHLYRQIAWARGSYESPYGRIASGWTCDGTTFRWRIGVPPNTTATVHIPAGVAEAVTESDTPLTKAQCVKFLKMENGHAVCQLQNGNYNFASTLDK